jgi:hypothetical protein
VGNAWQAQMKPTSNRQEAKYLAQHPIRTWGFHLLSFYFLPLGSREISSWKTKIANMQLLLLFTAAFIFAVTAASPIAEPQRETSQVSINHPNETSTSDVPIRVAIFSGSPGTKRCHGTAMLEFTLTRPGSLHAVPMCYDLPTPASCGVFIAGQGDGCEARLFSENRCRTFTNLAVFVPEFRTVGGFFRSVSIRCGVQSVQPPSLKLPAPQMPVRLE